MKSKNVQSMRVYSVGGGDECVSIVVCQEKNVLTKCHEDLAKNVENCPTPDSHVFSLIKTIFKLNQNIHKSNVLTKFHDDWTKNFTSRETNVLTKFHEDWAKNVSSEKTAPSTCGHVFPLIMTIFELAKNVTSRVKMTPPPFGHVFLLIGTIFKLNHQNCPPPGGHVFSPIWTIFDLVQDINETNVLTKFHDAWTKMVTSGVFTRNTAPPPGGHLHEDWASNVTSTVFTSMTQFRTWSRYHINVLTKFHEDRTRNVASRVFTGQNVDDGHTTDKKLSQKLTRSMLCSSKLKMETGITCN
ncbi:hypothetical protein DPMN_026111 [Dreissena polymorpha]|uniref:Uncharacterized protein n=1 Tax=Dreissena polymorpha TaxID=45954 RepID=A0A9D4LSS2_DREPO|nr:hypothetical protein DPMN_026111 [Dreissena polymorpha]